MSNSRSSLLACVSLTAIAMVLFIGGGSATFGQAPGQAAPGAQPSEAQQRAAAIQKALAESHAQLLHYQWIEETSVFLKGEEKSNSIKRCFYGEDGKVEKIPLDPPQESKPAHGLRGKIIAKKKAELTGAMQQAVALLHEYLPPDRERLQQAAAAGKLSVQVLSPGQRANLQVRDYIKPGDMLTIELDMPSNSILGLHVATSMGDSKDAVTLDVRMDHLSDGTLYQSESTLQCEAQKVKVVVANSGYRKAE